MELNNKVAVVTGAAGGIGSALCRALAANGAKVVVSDLNLEAAQVVATEIGGLAVACDVADEQSIIALIAEAENAYGTIDLFCSNAGFGVGDIDHAASASNETWQKNWDVHVMAHVYASRALLPKMIERGDGYLLNVASAAGLLSQISDAAYTATKHAAVAFAESLAISHADDGIKVSVVCPQYVATNILNGLAENAEQFVKDNASRGVLSPEECVAAIIEGIEKETFLILPHAEVADFEMRRAADRGRWIGGMRKLRASLIDEDGKVDLKRMFL